MKKKMSLLAILFLVALSLGSVAAVWYWSSPSLTSSTLIVTGRIEAKVIDPRSAYLLGMQTSYENLLEATELIEGINVGLDPNLEYLFVKIGSTNADALYLKLDVTSPDGMSVTANVRFLALESDYTWTVNDMLLATNVTLDGSQSINLELLDNPLYAMETFDTCLLFVVAEFNIEPGSLPVGSHSMSVIVSLGDTA